MSYSYTAFWTAAAWARESERADALFVDPFAGRLAGPRGQAALAASEAASGMPNPFLPIRTRWFDDRVSASDAKQLVVLGAGMDARAFRIRTPEAVFELDLAESFDHKERVLAGELPLARRTVVRTDVTGEWAVDLLAAGFDRRLPTQWVAEGLLFYLDGPAVGRMLRAAAGLSAPGSEFLADVFGSGLLGTPGMAEFIAARAKAALPPPFCTDQPEALFRAAGWQAHCTLAGSAEANFGRLPMLQPDLPSTESSVPGMRTYLVRAGIHAGV